MTEPIQSQPEGRNEMQNAKLVITIPTMIIGLILLAVGLALLFIVKAIDPPPSMIDAAVDRIIDGNSHCKADR